MEDLDWGFYMAIFLYGGFVLGFGLEYGLQGSVMRIWILDWYDGDYIIH